jgi:hypothetical protein
MAGAQHGKAGERHGMSEIAFTVWRLRRQAFKDFCCF